MNHSHPISLVNKASINNKIPLNKLPQTILIYGPPGVGKSIIGAQIATHILQNDNLTYNLSHPDLFYCDSRFHINSKTHKTKPSITVDEIREAISFSQKTGALSLKKVLILDDIAHLNSLSINAILKLIEEPGSDLFIIIVTGDIDCLPETVLSRATKFYCPPPSLNQYKQIIEEALEDRHNFTQIQDDNMIKVTANDLNLDECHSLLNGNIRLTLDLLKQGLLQDIFDRHKMIQHLSETENTHKKNSDMLISASLAALHHNAKQNTNADHTQYFRILDIANHATKHSLNHDAILSIILQEMYRIWPK